MAIYVEQNAAFEAVLEAGVSGLVGTIEVMVIDNDGATVIAPTTTNITEQGTSGVYVWNAPAAPAALGQYTILWSLDGTFSANTTSIDELVVVSASAGTLPPLPPAVDGGAPFAPCTAWTTEEDVAACCSVQVGSDLGLFTEVVAAASRALFELSGRRFSGTCQQTVFPRCVTNICLRQQVLSRGHVVWPDPFSDCWGFSCACHRDTVLLRGYPVREINEVLIDSSPLPVGSYELRDWRYLVRTDGQQWPSQEGWSVTYMYGQNPPELGQMAARELACELYKACVGDAECVLPVGVSRIQRQGIVIERNAFAAWGRQGDDRIWRTGLPITDLFLNTYNPAGLRRRPVFITPGRRLYPRSAGV